ncbi:AMP-binding protein [Sporichthya sp.]|uniref:AMP-binding protein n=1 Tax=Sporichthya sp. TaxID=65475 RepID=UPI0018377ACC|nr:AMP-binding protein [Sporichthya sp.]MBA3744977.1 AMP-binding protein [Sporichthya sp.]
MTFAATLAAQRPDEIALRATDADWTWAQVDAALRPLVNGMLAARYRPNRRVAIYAENSGQTVLYYAAATLAGCSAVAVNYHLTPEEAAYILTHSQADVLIVDDSTAERGWAAARLAGVLVVVGGSGAVTGTISLTQASAFGGEAEPATSHEPRPTMVYTSGTTGTPKGVELPWTSWVGGSSIDEHLSRLAEGSMVAHGRHLIVGPMYHSGPITGTRLFLGGAPVTVLGRFDAERFLATIEQHRIGSTIVVPTHLQRVMALPAQVREHYDLSPLRFMLQVGAKFPEPDKRAAIEWLASAGVPDVLYESYGASEVGTTCMISAAEWLERPGSVGRAVPGFEAMILDEEDKPVSPGTEGRLFFRADGQGMRYVDGTGTDAGAPFTLGEIGVMDEAGYVWITDRASDMVVSGGVNIYPAEAEKVLADHPGVADVACIGVPHPDLGEALVALVVAVDPFAEPAAEDLLAHCRENLTLYKCPREIVFVEALQRTPVGKVDKREMRAPYWP